MTEAEDVLANITARLLELQEVIEVVSVDTGTALRELLAEDPDAGQEHLHAALFSITEAIKEIANQTENLKDENEDEETNE